MRFSSGKYQSGLIFYIYLGSCHLKQTVPNCTFYIVLDLKKCLFKHFAIKLSQLFRFFCSQNYPFKDHKSKLEANFLLCFVFTLINTNRRPHFLLKAFISKELHYIELSEWSEITPFLPISWYYFSFVFRFFSVKF